MPSHKDLSGWLNNIAGNAKIKKLKYSSEYLIDENENLHIKTINFAK